MKHAFLFLFVACEALIVSAIQTAEEYAHSLEERFLEGEPAVSIRECFMTNGAFTAYDILPYCYMFEPDTNDLEVAISAFEKKVAFLQCIYSRDYRFMPQAFFTNVLYPFEGKLADLRHRTFRYARINVGSLLATNLNARLSLAEYAYIRNVDGFINASEKLGHPRKYVDSFLHNNTSFDGRSRELANFAAYGIPFEELVAELSTNRSVRANENFRHAISQGSGFSTNNILSAVCNIRRKNNALKIIVQSCMLKTNETNRALSTMYSSTLTNVYDHYEAAPPSALGLSQEEKEEWLGNLREAIEIYTSSTPFK